MSAAKVPYGKPVKLLIDFQGFPDGRLVMFEIWKKKGQNEEKIAKVYGATKGGKAYGVWNPNFEEYTVELMENEGEIKEQAEDEKYYFIAKIDDHEAKSGDLEFSYPLDIYLEDDGNPLDNVEYTVTLSDGSKKQGKFLGGHAKLTDVPIGKFKIEVDGYSPGILYGVVQ